MINHADALRELEKVYLAIDAAHDYLCKYNQANAALHMQEKVLYSPLTLTMAHAHVSLKNVADMIRSEIDDNDT